MPKRNVTAEDAPAISLHAIGAIALGALAIGAVLGQWRLGDWRSDVRASADWKSTN